MIEALWSGKNGLWRLLTPFSVIYALVSGLNRYLYRWGLRASYRPPVPVVVVGNLTAGGNGKTPVVIWLVTYLRKQGYRPAVVSRGYGGKAKHYPLIIDNLTLAEHAGDEPVLIFQRTGVPVAVAPDRSAAVRRILQHDPNIDVIITDDGLQHYALQRDIEIVVIDGERRFGNGWLIPAGPMRERTTRLKTVDAVIVNGTTRVQTDIAMQLMPGDAINLFHGQQKPAKDLLGTVAMAGIGYPPRFFSMLRQIGVKVEREVAFADHHAYSEAELHSLTSSTTPLLMTEKDAVKCRHFAAENWWYMPVEAVLQGPALPTLLTQITTLIAARRG